MTDTHSELEVKFSAHHVSEWNFKTWCSNQQPRRFESVGYPDVYYRHGDNVVRHRLISGSGELTVKQRKSSQSTTDRVEVDLTFSDRVTREDVQAFLAASGWHHDLTLVKNFSHAFWFRHGDATVTVALYEVKREDGSDVRRFLEAEVEKGSNVTDKMARSILTCWSGILQEDFDLGEPLNESLYETYSGRQYVIK